MFQNSENVIEKNQTFNGARHPQQNVNEIFLIGHTDNKKKKLKRAFFSLGFFPISSECGSNRDIDWW